MLPLFLLCLSRRVSSEEDNCALESWNPAVNGLASVGQSARTLPEQFGIPVNATFPGIDELTSDPFPYGASLGAFAIPLAVIFALYFICLPCHFLFSWCPCCRAKEGRPQPGLVKKLLYIAGCGLLVATAAMFFFAAANLTAALDRIVGLPVVVNSSLGGVFDTLNDVSVEAFTQIRGLIGEVENEAKDLIDWLKVNGTQARVCAADLNEELLDGYKSHFDGDYTTKLDALIAALAPQGNGGSEKAARLVVMKGSLEEAVKAAKQVAVKLLDASDSIDGFRQQMEDQVNENIAKAKDKVVEYEDVTLMSTLDDVGTKINDIVALAQDALAPVESVRSTITSVIYCVCGFFLAVALVYGVVYFFNCCCARCLVICFPCFGLLFTLTIILPGVMISAFFYPLFDVCPQLESVLDSSLPSDMFKAGSSPGTILECKEETPLLDALDLDFDPQAMIDDAVASVRTGISGGGMTVSSGGVSESMKGFAEGFSPQDNLTSNAFHFDFNTLLLEIGGDIATGLHQYIVAADPLKLVKIRSNFDEVLTFGLAVEGKANKSADAVSGLIDRFQEDGLKLLDSGINSITCRPAKCIYAPLKNALCKDFISGVAFWIISTICLAVGIFWMEIGLCIRRRSMVNPKVEAQEGADNELDELERQKFAAKRKKRNRAKRHREPEAHSGE